MSTPELPSELRCTATGYTQSSSTSDREPIYATETTGVWGPATAIFSPVSGGQLNGVSCASATDCTAIGDNSFGDPIYAAETTGTWTEFVPPGAPRLRKVTPGNKLATVTWTAPTGGSSVASYTATAVRGTHTFTCTTSQKGCTIHGLTNGTTYAVSVVATNAVGSSARSATRSTKPRA